jgi:hypothetical protein
MKRVALVAVVLMLAAGSRGTPGSAGSVIAAEQTWVGEISDSACGREHESGTENVPAPPAKECVANCVRGGSRYVIVVDGKVLQIANQTTAGLADLAGSKVKVTGELNDRTITIATLEKAD